MKVVRLEKSLEPAFWNHVNRDLVGYYFFVFDWKLYKDKTKIFLAIEEDKIKGLLLVYRDYIVQLRGNREAARLLLNQICLDKFELQAPLDCLDIIRRKYSPRVKEKMSLMYLRKEEENIQMTTAPKILGIEDGEKIVELMKNADPIRWAEIAVENLEKCSENSLWIGIEQDHRLVSAGTAQLMDFGGHIGIVATRREYRNRGHATSVVTALVKEILKVSSVAVIHVLNDNTPAIRVYSKVGFKPYKTYLTLRT
ncbi:MAG: GNAT family N-acetyltransferase [Candidatus Bathyarchaeia archaeon]